MKAATCRKALHRSIWRTIAKWRRMQSPPRMTQSGRKLDACSKSTKYSILRNRVCWVAESARNEQWPIPRSTVHTRPASMDEDDSTPWLVVVFTSPLTLAWTDTDVGVAFTADSD